MPVQSVVKGSQLHVPITRVKVDGDTPCIHESAQRIGRETYINRCTNQGQLTDVGASIMLRRERGSVPRLELHRSPFPVPCVGGEAHSAGKRFMVAWGIAERKFSSSVQSG